MDFSTPQLEAVLPLGMALAVGFIIGFERGWHEREHAEVRPDGEGGPRPEGHAVAGVRTFALTGLFGGVLAALSAALTPWVLVAGLLALAAPLTVGYALSTRGAGDFGATTEVALLLTVALGALAGTGTYLPAVAAAVTVAVLLGFKAEIHGVIRRLDRREIQASLQLLVIAVVVLPLLPNRAMGPWDSLNPRTIGLLVMLIAGIGFVGYFAVRLIGARGGLLLTGLLGGITSSTAVTVAFARLARRSEMRHALFGAGIAVACATMAPRVAIEVAAVNAALLPKLAPGLLVLGIVPIVAAVWVARRTGGEDHSAAPGIDNPLELRQALVIALVLAVVFMLSHGAEARLGERGIYVLAALSGIADVDAIALALSQQSRGEGAGLADTVAARGILIAALVNTGVKAAIAAVVGGPRLARWASSILGLALVAAALTLPLI